MQLEILNSTGYDLTERQKELLSKAADEALSMGINDSKNGHAAEACLSIVNNTEIRRLNAKYRELDKVTDVLSFPMQDFAGDVDFLKSPELGDIVISIERAQEQAEEYGHSIERELCFLTAHSVLHLLGYDHEEAHEDEEMCRIQEEALRKLGLHR